MKENIARKYTAMQKDFEKKVNTGKTGNLTLSDLLSIGVIAKELLRKHKEKDYNWYKYGNILPYYSQIRDFYEKNGIPVPESDSILQEHFEYHVGKAIDSILSEVEK